MQRPANVDKLKQIIKQNILDSLEKTKDISKKNTVSMSPHAMKRLEQEIRRGQSNIAENTSYLIILSIILFSLLLFGTSSLPQGYFISLTLVLMCLLIVGVSTPMIDLDARITHLGFSVRGQSVVFEDQILFYQSKSAWDVFWLMVKHPEIKMKFVGLLIITFSVFFPLLKLISSTLFYKNAWNTRNLKFIRFFALQSGKWSMADVFVVAIFMAYIGLNGIVNSQLKDLQENGHGMEVLTTNGTSLQSGFYVFLTYTLLAMVMSRSLSKHISETN